MCCQGLMSVCGSGSGFSILLRAQIPLLSCSDSSVDFLHYCIQTSCLQIRTIDVFPHLYPLFLLLAWSCQWGPLSCWALSSLFLVFLVMLLAFSCPALDKILAFGFWAVLCAQTWHEDCELQSFQGSWGGVSISGSAAPSAALPSSGERFPSSPPSPSFQPLRKRKEGAGTLPTFCSITRNCPNHFHSRSTGQNLVLCSDQAQWEAGKCCPEWSHLSAQPNLPLL